MIGPTFVIVSAFVAVYLLFRLTPVPLSTVREEADRMAEESYGEWPA